MSRDRDDRKRAARIAGATDPTTVPGTIVGPGFDDPHSRDSVVVDTSNAVLLDHSAAAIVHLERAGQPAGEAIGLTLAGRVNQRRERAEVLFLFDEDGAVAIIAELIGIAARAGLPSFPGKLEAALDRMPT